MGFRNGSIGAALSVVLLVGGCSQSTAPELDLLDGRWLWVDATGGIAGMTITPASVGYTMTVEYSSQPGGPALFRVLRDGQLFSETTVERFGELKGTLRYRDPVLGWPEQEFELRGADTLLLVDGCCDGFAYRFERGE